MNLFNRSVRVIVGTSGLKQTTKIFHVRIRFKVEKTDSFFSNKATIELLNLNDESKRFLETPKLSVRLDAGYDGRFPMLFFGDVTNCITAMEKGNNKGGDIVTTIEAGDGERSLTDSHIEISLGPRTTNRQAFQRILASLNMTTTTMKEFREITYTRGFQFCGRAREALDRIMREVGYTWSVQNGEIQALGQKDNVGEVATIVQESTGLIDYPKKGTSTSTEGSTEEYDWQFSNLLNADIAPGRLVKLISPITKTVLIRVSKANYEGDSQEGEYKVTAEGFLASPK
jgi:hypothetical protein